MTVGTNPLNPDVESYFSIRSESGRVQFAVDYNTLVTVQVSTYCHHSNPVVLEPNKSFALYQASVDSGIWLKHQSKV